jgi:multimeric flavodoxin WrbA
MNIAVLNANPKVSPFDGYLNDLQASLESDGHRVTVIPLRERTIRFCAGCFACWVKTPGECAIPDDGPEFRRAVIRSDFTLLASPLRMGFPSALLKKTIDRLLPLLHPYFEPVHAEAHHRRRYDRYPRLGLLLEKEPDTDGRDLSIVSDIFRRAALDLKSALDFALTTEIHPTELARRIASPDVKPLPPAPYRKPTTGAAILPPAKILLLNGSPHGARGTTQALLDAFGEGFASMPGKSAVRHVLAHPPQPEKLFRAFADAECVWLGTPLYVDAMPGIVKAFVETLEPLRGRRGNPPVGFFIQSGFPEGLHSRYLEAWFEKLAARLDTAYLGTVVRGAAPFTGNTARVLRRLGRGFALNGALDPKALRSIVGMERFPPLPDPIWRILLRLMNANGYFNSQLKQNGAYERRFATPYLDHS